MNLKKIDKKYIVRIGSVLLGIVIWILLIYTENADFEASLNGIKVQISGEGTLMNNNLVITNKGEVVDGSVDVRGKRSDIIEFMGNINAVVDVSNITAPGEYDVKIKYEVNSNALSVTKREVDSVKIKVERTALKEFNLEVVQTGTKNNELLVESIPEMPKVSIEGAWSDIDRISRAVVFVDITGMESENSSECQVKFTDASYKEIEFVNKKNVPVENVRVTNRVHKQAVLPVELKFSKEDKEKYVFETEWISKKDIMVGLEEGIELKKLYVTIDEEEYSDEPTEYVASWYDLTGVYIPNKDKEEIKVRVSAFPIVEKEVSFPLRVDADEGRTFVVDESIILKLRGAEKFMKEENIKASIDIKGLEPGIHEVKVNVELPEGNKVWMDAEPSVSVEIQ